MNQNKSVELLTARLRLRPLHEDDLVHIQRYGVIEEFYRYLPIDRQTADDIEVFLKARLADQEDGKQDRLTLAIEPFDVGHIIGTVRLEVQDRNHKQDDIGYAMNLEYHGKGYMSEAVNRVLETAFCEFGLHRVWATVDTENERSCKLLERVGMTREGHLRHDMFIRGEWRDSFLYSILAR